MGGEDMEAVGTIMDRVLAGLGSADHIPALDGDSIGADGLLHCGKCGEPKEYQIMPGRYVGCICGCRKRELREEAEETQRQREEAAVRELAEYSLIDERFRASTFEAFRADTEQDKRIKRIAESYVKRFDEMYERGIGLLLYGSPGTGKTFVASCIANALMAQRVPVLVTSIVRLTANAFGDDLNELIQHMNAARLLVLDDFGAERDTSTKAEQVFSLIDARYASRKPMIITTNICDFRSGPDIRRRRVYDRLTEACTPIKMDGESKRRQAAKEKHKSIMEMLEG